MKFQYIRQKGQKTGNQLEIVPLDDWIFRMAILPRLRAGYAETLEDWQALHPEITHYSKVRGEGITHFRDWEFVRAGPVAMLRPPAHDDRWIEVRSWSSPEAGRWARLTRVPRKQDWSPRSR